MNRELGSLTATSRLQDSSAASVPANDSGQRAISVEWLAYLCLGLLGLLLRVAELGSLPLNDAEVGNALHAWHSLEDAAPGSATPANSPLTYISQMLSFSLLGANEFSARLLSMLAGCALTLTPLLFREHLGRTRAFVWAALLSLLAIPIATSRAADGSSFMLLFALLAVWMVRRYWYSQRLSDARWAFALVTLMTLLSSPSGLPLLIIMLAAGWLAVWRTAISAPQRLNLPGDDILQLAMRRLRAFPLGQTALVPLMTVGLVATGFMLNPAGLRAVSQLLADALAGFTQSAGIDGTRLGLAALLVYEPLLIVFAMGGAWLLWRQGAVTYLDRFAAAWALIGALGLLLYPGAKPADAMWVVLPLTLLASYGIAQLMVDRRVVILWDTEDDAEGGTGELGGAELYSTAYWWVKWLICAVVLTLLLILSVQFMQVARLMLTLPADAGLGEALGLLADSSQLRLLQALGMLLLAAIVMIATCLLLANYWGTGTCLQGIGLGFLGLMLLSGLGGGWGIAAADPAEPDGLWRQKALSHDVKLLQATLRELAMQQSGGFPYLAVTIVEDSNNGISGTGRVAWLLRDYVHARFVPSASQASGEPVLLIADDESQAAQLSGDYVGQRFLLSRSWSWAQQSLWDLPAWWTQTRRRPGGDLREAALILWLRQDVYAGAPPRESNSVGY
ncbi:MAG: hypothetical protein F4243_14770 [Chloroflexi bacterium]|nr:hypothetical protein [Chloroflexota bacterium]MYD37991.1 hypothetical protein [Chloroflexota bacterium]MYE80204.1 hypothetical protein [Chloroflexota bacterium]